VIVQKLGEVIRKLKEREYTIILVEQNFRFAAPLADRMFIVEHGQVVEEIAQHEIRKSSTCCRSTSGSDHRIPFIHTKEETP
jgi:ABC-type branched-subunit amino acid transport system ATPase component